MNKKMLIGFIAIVVLAGLTTAGIALNQTKNINTTPRAETLNRADTAPTSPVRAMNKKSALKEYSDPSGFRFLYPSTLTIVVEQNDSDPDLYASIKLKDPNSSDYISVRAITSNFGKIDDWLRANKLSPASVKRVKLGDLDAYQAPIQKQVATAALDSGVIFTVIAVNSGNAPLMEAYDAIIKNFSFYQPAGTSVDTAPTSAPADVPADDTEEVIQ